MEQQDKDWPELIQDGKDKIAEVLDRVTPEKVIDTTASVIGGIGILIYEAKGAIGCIGALFVITFLMDNCK